MKTILLVLGFAMGTNGWAGERICRGEVPINSGIHKGEVTFSLPEFSEGAWFSLWHPVTYDFEAGMRMRVIRVQRAHGVEVVEALIEERGAIGYMAFEKTEEADGSAVLHRFRGVEGENVFGPAEVACRVER